MYRISIVASLPTMRVLSRPHFSVQSWRHGISSFLAIVDVLDKAYVSGYVFLTRVIIPNIDCSSIWPSTGNQHTAKQAVWHLRQARLQFQLTGLRHTMSRLAPTGRLYCKPAPGYYVPTCVWRTDGCQSLRFASITCLRWQVYWQEDMNGCTCMWKDTRLSIALKSEETLKISKSTFW